MHIRLSVLTFERHYEIQQLFGGSKFIINIGGGFIVPHKLLRGVLNYN